MTNNSCKLNREQQAERTPECGIIGPAEDILGLLVHQCSQPLSNLSLIIDDIDDAAAFGELDEAYLKQSVAEAHRQIEFLADTIANFRGLATPVEEEGDTFDPRQAIVEVVRVMSPQLRARNIRLNITCDCRGGSILHDGVDAIISCSRETTAIRGNATEFRQVILNLIANARDELAECLSLGLIAPGHAEIDVSIDVDDAAITAHITDNGRGIPAPVAEKIFQRGFTTKPRTSATGFGLHLVKVIIESRLGGSVEVVNETGAHFTLRIPRKAA